MHSAHLTTVLLAAAVIACQSHGGSSPQTHATAPPPPNSAAPKPRSPEHAPLVHERSEIPAGAFEAGSRPGSKGRRPQIEQEAMTVELGGFEIDRLPYPNDPAHPPLTNVTREEAGARCAERGARLCTELEWERACKGPQSEPYATGHTLLPDCLSDPTRCASGFQVLSMGLMLREWTKSDVVPSNTDASRRAAVRGAKEGPSEDHRCAQRQAVPPDTRSADLGFRCCHGAPNAARVTEPTEHAVFEKPALSAERVAALLAASPETKSLAEKWTFFQEPDAAETVVSRGPGERQGLRFTVAPLLYSPVRGTRYLLITGRSGKETSLVAAFWVVGKDQYELAASMVMKNEPGPVAFAYHESIKPRLFFSTCWKCPGETGRLIYRDPDRIAIVQP